MAEIPSEVRSSEKEQAPQCGVATIEDAEPFAEAKATRSPLVRGARGGNSARGARANPNRSKQRAAAAARPAASTEVADQGIMAALPKFINLKEGSEGSGAAVRHLRKQKRPERVNRNEQCEALQASSATIEVADQVDVGAQALTSYIKRRLLL